RLIIGFTGLMGAGKTSGGKFLESEFGFRYLRYSQVLAEWQHQDPSAKNQLQGVGWEIMAGGMQAELNRRLIAQINSAGDYAVDGLRHPIDHQSLEEKFDSAYHLLYIESQPETRWERLKQTSRFHNSSDFVAADTHPVEQQISSLKQSADCVVQND